MSGFFISAATTLGVTPLLWLLAASIALLLFLIIGLRWQAFLALTFVSFALAIAAGTPLVDVPGVLSSGMGKSLQVIAFIIGIGAIFGELMEHSGAARSLARSLLRGFGEKRAAWAMALTGFVVSIPVFLDVAVVILAPIIYAMSRRTGKSAAFFGLPLLSGLSVSHAFVPPTPGPVAVAAMLNVSLGQAILTGIAIGLPTALIVGVLLAPKLATLTPGTGDLPFIDEPPASEEKRDPGLGIVLLLLGLPIILMVIGSVVEQSVATGLPAGLDLDARKVALHDAMVAAPWWQGALIFLGNPVTALLLATILSLFFLGLARGSTSNELLELSTKALAPAGLIILITGAGGVFKEVLGQTGVANALRDAFQGSPLTPLMLGYVFATVIRIAQGSATVAMLTAGGLLAGLSTGLSQDYLSFCVISIAAGASGFSHVNDSGFWIVSRYFGLTEKETLRTWTILSTAVSFIGFALCLIGSMLWCGRV